MAGRVACVLAFAVCIGLSGCDTYTAGSYNVSMSSDIILKKLAPANITVQPFTIATGPSMMCRLVGPINLPSGQTPQTYVANAFKDQFELAGLTGGATQPVVIAGQITKFGFSSMMSDGSWDLAVTLKSSNGRVLPVSVSYPFGASFVGDAACHNVSDAFEPAVQALVKKAVSAPGFRALLMPRAPAEPGNV